MTARGRMCGFLGDKHLAWVGWTWEGFSEKVTPALSRAGWGWRGSTWQMAGAAWMEVLRGTDLSMSAHTRRVTWEYHVVSPLVR